MSNHPLSATLDLPDLPRWVEAHGLLADPQSWIERWPGGAVVGNGAEELAVICGELEPASVHALAERHRSYHLLSVDPALVLPRRTRERALLHTLTEPVEDPQELVSLLLPEHSLDHVPEPLRRELTRARGRQPVWAAWVDGLPVSFAYAPWRSPIWFDISVDTLASARQLGLGALVARRLIAAETAAGRAAVWGATESNHASLRLAASLGFVEVDALWVHGPAEAP